MDWLLKALTSTIGRKILVSLTGILLCGFVIAHLGGNLLMLVSADAYNTYAHTLHSFEAGVKAAEAVLAILFATHIGIAIIVSRQNLQARSVNYAAKQTKQEEKKLGLSAENWMAVSGLVFFAFLAIHLCDFTFGIPVFLDPSIIKNMEPFDKAVTILQHPFTALIYMTGSLILAWHLSHGARSMFQTLGLNHPKYNPLFKGFAGLMFAAAAAFAIFPIYANILSPPETASAEENANDSLDKTAVLPAEKAKH